MKREIIDFWRQQASSHEEDGIEALRRVLDPSDVKGVKNSYIDAYLKYYLRKYLAPGKEDTLLEVGCGTGRLTEYMSQFVNSVYGIDIIDKFIDDCRANPRKGKNTLYLYNSEMEKLKDIPINKMYIVWVLMYLTERAELIETLADYRNNLSVLKSATIIEQVTNVSQCDYRKGRISCCYRSIEEYTEIFATAGFKVKGRHILGERHNGSLYRIIHLTCNILPRGLAAFSDRLFYLDRYMMGNNADRTVLINNKRPTDVLFQLEVV